MNVNETARLINETGGNESNGYLYPREKRASRITHELRLEPRFQV